ncbi:MAG: CDP-glucose 4,6-dehydratase, partial [Gammaproteobacteria bacterium]
GDWAANRLIPDIVRASKQKQSLSIRHPQAIRPWQWVLEPLGGYMRLAQGLWQNPEIYSGAWNFGPTYNHALSVQQLLELWSSMWPWKLDWQVEKSDFHEHQLLKLDVNKAMKYLNWQNKMDEEQIIAWTVAWYKAWMDGKNMEEETLKQIENYEYLLG